MTHEERSCPSRPGTQPDGIRSDVKVHSRGNVRIGLHVELEQGVILKCFAPGSEEMITLGDFVRVQEYTLLHSLKGSIEVGDHSYIGPFCAVYGHKHAGLGGTKIGKSVLIGAHCAIVPANHNFSDPDRLIREQGFTSKGIVIEDDVWIGAHCTILDGVTIGKGAVVAAGSVVKSDVPSFAVVAGVPAVVKKMRTHAGVGRPIQV